MRRFSLETRKIKIAIIGCGGMGSYHYRRMKRSKLFDIVGILDTDDGKKMYAKQHGLLFFSSFEELSAYPGLDAVLIATPNDVHYDYMMKSAEKGLHILCEKPVTMNSSLLAEMIKKAKEKKVLFMVHQNRRWDRDYMTARNVIESGLIGGVYKIESRVMGSHGIPGDWRKVKSQGGGMIFDWGVHLIDQLLYLIDSPVKSVYCKNSYVYGLEVDDGFELRLTFQNGMETTVVIDTNSFVSLPRWMIYGYDGTAIIKNWSIKGKIVSVKIRKDIKNKGIKAGNGFTKTMADRSHSTVKKHRLPKAANDSNALYRNFCGCILKGETPVIKGEEVMRVMKVIEAAFKSSESNQVIETEI